MKLVLAIIHADDAASCCDALADAGLACTRLPAVGGFLGRENIALLTGCDETRVDEVVDVIGQRSRSRVEELTPMTGGANPVDVLQPLAVEVEVGGATIFVLDVERFVRL